MGAMRKSEYPRRSETITEMTVGATDSHGDRKFLASFEPIVIVEIAGPLREWGVECTCRLHVQDSVYGALTRKLIISVDIAKT